MSDFDEEVRRLRLLGVRPKHKRCGKRKSECTPEEWAAHREYMAAWYRKPASKQSHRRSQIRYLSKTKQTA